MNKNCISLCSSSWLVSPHYTRSNKLHLETIYSISLTITVWMVYETHIYSVSTNHTTLIVQLSGQHKQTMGYALRIGWFAAINPWQLYCDYNIFSTSIQTFEYKRMLLPKKQSITHATYIVLRDQPNSKWAPPLPVSFLYWVILVVKHPLLKHNHCCNVENSFTVYIITLRAGYETTSCLGKF